MSKRKLEEGATEADSVSFEVTISKDKPLTDYIQLIRAYVQSDKLIADEVLKTNFQRISKAARDVIWQLLFDEDDKKDKDAGDASDAAKKKTGNGDEADTSAKKDATEAADAKQQKAAELLEEHKCDACFYSPWEYNEWILTVRDELLKRKMFIFWRESIVKKELGPCWAKDSDLFDDLEDPEPAAFYAHAGCVAPFSKEDEDDDEEDDDVVAVEQSSAAAATANNVVSSSANSQAAAAADAAVNGDFEAILSDDAPVVDYQELMQQYVRAEDLCSDELLAENFKKIAAAARTAIWRFIFEQGDGGNPNAEQTQLAAELLEEYKGDACFYDPWEYNIWIVTLRDELLKREMLDFWRNIVVRLELGPCWAKDSDYFEDMEDPAPAAFYAFGGCKAPFSREASENPEEVNSSEDDNGENEKKQAAAADKATSATHETNK